jgi:hypothetical protein
MGLKMKYFVLNPCSSNGIRAQASRLAMLAYADAVRSDDQQLAVELEDWVDDTLAPVPDEDDTPTSGYSSA